MFPSFRKVLSCPLWPVFFLTWTVKVLGDVCYVSYLLSLSSVLVVLVQLLDVTAYSVVGWWVFHSLSVPSSSWIRPFAIYCGLSTVTQPMFAKNPWNLAMDWCRPVLAYHWVFAFVVAEQQPLVCRYHSTSTDQLVDIWVALRFSQLLY